MTTRTTIRQDDTTRMELWLSPHGYHLRTEYLEPGFEDTPQNWWAYKTPFVYDTNGGQWEIWYRIGEENIPKLTQGERAECARRIMEFDDEITF